MRAIAAALVLAMAAFSMPQPVLAHPFCAPREAYVEHLAMKWGEAPVSHGLLSDGRLLEMFATPDGSTWTLVVTSPEGVSCTGASGEHWRKTMPELLKPMGLPV